MSLKNRLKPTEHRQGNLINLVDLIHELLGVAGNTDELGYVKDKNKLQSLTEELHEFDITTIGDLYLTSGGRVVLDQGYGEYFVGGDKKIFTLEELKVGINYENFLDRLKSVKEGK